MSRNRFGIRLVCAVTACVAVGVPASAQQQSGGPFSGLFRGSPRDQPQTLDLRGSAFAAWDDNLLAQVPGGGGGDGFNTVDPRLIKQGIANGLQGSLVYGLRKGGTRSQFNLAGDASVQEFASQLGGSPLWFYNYNASAGLRTSLTTRTTLSFSLASTYAPYYQYAPFLKNTTSEESPVGSDQGFAVNSEWVRSTTAAASVANQFSKKSSISGGVIWEQRVIPGNEQGNIETRQVGGTFNHSLTRKLGFHVGYAVLEARNTFNPDAKPVRTQSMDVGLGYGDGLTLRLGARTTLSLTIGASIAKNGDPVSVATTKQSALVVTGGATLNHSLSRTWGTSLAYLRGTSYVVGFNQPVMTDSANAGIGGPLTSRLQLTAGAGASRGQQLFTESGGDIVSYTASTRLTFGMFSNLGLYAQASYYRFSIPPGFSNFGFVPDLDRRTVSVGLTTWLPLIKQRRARADSGGQPTTGQP